MHRGAIGKRGRHGGPGSVPDQHNKASPNLFAGAKSCLQFVQNTTSVEALK